MKRTSSVVFFSLVFISFCLVATTNSEEIKKEECFFLSSLHHTAKGMAYWYDKANGGLETISGVPYSNLGCQNCHISSCDACHKIEEEGKPSYSAKAARNQEVCLRCHKREASIMQIDKAENTPDVHFGRGMQCMDCHSEKDVHGDGTEYNSMKQRGVLGAKCENCHESVRASASHTIHRDKLDCESCHVRQVVSCSNCHFETLLKEGKRVAVPLSGWVFLMNYEGKVTSANMQTFVVPGNKTFLMFAPQNSHSITKEGRKCRECHATEIVNQVQKGKLSLTWLENGVVKQAKGVIPVVDGVTYDFVYQNYQNGKWVPIENPQVPVLHYAGFGTPLSKEQLKKLAMPMGKK